MKAIRWLAPLVALFLLCAAAAPGLVSAQGSIQINRPEAGSVVTSPLRVTGYTAAPTDSMNFTVVGVRSGQIGSGSFPVKSPFDPPFDFTGTVTFDAPQPGDTLIVTLSGGDGSSASVNVLAPGAPPPPTPQTIVISSPPNGTQVGSPVTLTGFTTSFPPTGFLNFSITSATGAPLGQGAFPVQPSGAGSTWAASLQFQPPAQGGPVTATVFQIDPATGQTTASAAVSLTTEAAASGQVIVITSPARGATVGSPMTVTGYTTQYPQNGLLAFVVRQANGNIIGGGTFPVSPLGGGSTFVGSVTFAVPPTGQPLTVTLADYNFASGQVIARAELPVTTAR
ncbi:MAG: Gmad2 immunoglobulin-like domain-containing protein [Anaerolineae bacterium]